MAQEYSFTQQERNNLFAPSKVYSSFGRDHINDFMMLHVYDTDGNLIVTKVLALNEVSFENDGDFIDINVGQHLRDLGFQEGEYDVVYKFLRRLAGRERNVFVDASGNIFNSDKELRGTLGSYINKYYNVSRMHSGISYCSPIEYEALAA